MRTPVCTRSTVIVAAGAAGRRGRGVGRARRIVVIMVHMYQDAVKRRGATAIIAVSRSDAETCAARVGLGLVGLGSGGAGRGPAQRRVLAAPRAVRAWRAGGGTARPGGVLARRADPRVRRDARRGAVARALH